MSKTPENSIATKAMDESDHGALVNATDHVEDSTTFDDLLPLAPVLDGLTRHMDVDSLKSLAQTSKDWWHVTNEALSKKCRIYIISLTPPTKPQRSYECVDMYGDSNRDHIPLSVKSLNIYKSCKTRPKYLKKFTKLQKLSLYNSFVYKESYYPRIKRFEMKFDHNHCVLKRYSALNLPVDFKPIDLTEVVFPNLEECVFNWAPHNVIDDQCQKSLCNFIDNHRQLKSLVLEVHHLQLDPFLSLAKCQQIHTLKLYKAPIGVIPYLNKMKGLRNLQLTYEISSLYELELENIETLDCTCYCEFAPSFRNWTPSTALTTLRLSHIRKNTEFSLEDLAKKFPSLQTLAIETISECTVLDTGFFPNLTALEWSVYIDYPESNIQFVVAPNLERLTVKDSMLDELAIEHIATKFPKLKHLSYNPDDFNSSFNECLLFVECFPRLESLDVYGTVTGLDCFFETYNRCYKTYGQGFPQCKYMFNTHTHYTDAYHNYFLPFSELCVWQTVKNSQNGFP